MHSYVIHDEHGYYAGTRVSGKTRVTFWSRLKRDAVRIHFREVAERIATRLPFPTEIKIVKGGAA